MRTRNIAKAALFAAVIVAAGCSGPSPIVIELPMPKPVTPPNESEWVWTSKVSKIDVKTLEVVEMTLREWHGKCAPDKTGRFKNPKTGKCTMTDIMACAACGKQIPVPQLPDSALNLPEREKAAAMDKARQEYKCPRCGQSPFLLEVIT